MFKQIPKINANAFIKCWNVFSSHFVQQNSDWLSIYDSNTEWTSCFLGGKQSGNSNSPIGEFFKEKFGIEYRTEDGSFDLSFSSAKKYENLSCLNKRGIEKFNVEGFYPVMYDVIIEIENNFRCAWQEMTKLTWVRSPLKVIITYNWHPNDIEIWEQEDKVLVATFSEIIRQSNVGFADNSKTEYLLLVGNNEGQKLNWKPYKFDSGGNIKEKNSVRKFRTNHGKEK